MCDAVTGPRIWLTGDGPDLAGCAAAAGVVTSLTFGGQVIAPLAQLGLTSLRDVVLTLAVTVGTRGMAFLADLVSAWLPRVLEIEAMAFYGCPELRHLQLSDGLRSIGALAFAGCSLLRVPLLTNATVVGGSTFLWIEACRNTSCVEALAGPVPSDADADADAVFVAPVVAAVCCVFILAVWLRRRRGSGVVMNDFIEEPGSGDSVTDIVYETAFAGEAGIPAAGDVGFYETVFAADGWWSSDDAPASVYAVANGEAKYEEPVALTSA